MTIPNRPGDRHSLPLASLRSLREGRLRWSCYRRLSRIQALLQALNDTPREVNP